MKVCPDDRLELVPQRNVFVGGQVRAFLAKIRLQVASKGSDHNTPTPTAPTSALLSCGKLYAHLSELLSNQQMLPLAEVAGYAERG